MSEEAPMQLDMLRSDPASRSVLEDRARALSRQDVATETEAGTSTISFLLGGCSYSLSAPSVREVLALPPITPLPATPPFVAGLANVRGRLVVALDLRPLLEIPAAPPVPGSLLLVIGVGDLTAGLIVDSVIAVSHQAETLAPTPSATAGRGQPWVRGVDSTLSLHLDGDVLLADPRLAVNAEGAE